MSGSENVLFLTRDFNESDVSNVENEQDFQAAPADFEELSLSSSDWTVETLHSQIVKGNIDLCPAFQRRGVWDTSKKSAFIESLVMNIPVPQIVLAKKPDSRGEYLVLDGKQRLLSLKGYYAGDFAVRKDGLIPELNGKKYADLDDDVKDALDNSTIRAVRLSQWKSEAVLYAIFHRLNTGSVPLNTQELRSALLSGPFTNYAADFTEKDFTLAMLLNSSADGPDFRMRDIELFTRYCGVTRMPELFQGNLREFLDNTTRRLNSCFDPSQYESFANDMVRTIDLYREVYRLIDKDSPTFSLIQPGKNTRFNRAVFDALCFPCKDVWVRESLNRHREQVSASLSMLLRNQDFINSCSLSTKTRASLERRIGLWADCLTGILGPEVQVPRLSLNDGD